MELPAELNIATLPCVSCIKHAALPCVCMCMCVRVCVCEGAWGSVLPLCVCVCVSLGALGERAPPCVRVCVCVCEKRCAYMRCTT